MATTKTPRALARDAQIDKIKGVARRLIAEKSVTGLSLREVAREMGLVSSALYRYFATRDELLTALILDSYNDLGASVERADARIARDDAYGRWRASVRAMRRWARAKPHEYALIYGTPLPGYQAPLETIAAATRVVVVLGDIVSASRQRRPPRSASRAESADVRTYLDVEALAVVMPGVATSDYLRAMMAFTELFGFISLELFGQYVGSVTNANVMFERVIEELARSLDLEVPERG